MEKGTKGRAALAAAVGLVAVMLIVGIIAGIKVMQFATIGEAFAAQVPAGRARERGRGATSSIGSRECPASAPSSPCREPRSAPRPTASCATIRFEAGSIVEAGDELVLLDDEVEQSQLRSAEASAELASLSFERAKRLIAQRAISQSDLEEAQATWKQAQAQVDNIRAVIAKKIVRAPFAGKVGIRRVSVGDFLEKGVPVVSLQSLDPVYVEFSLPQQRLGQVREGLAVTAAADSYPGEEFGGEITAVEAHVDVATRNVRVQATFANGHGALKPGHVRLGESGARNDRNPCT